MLVQSKLIRLILSVLVYFVIVLNQCSTTHAATDYCNTKSCKDYKKGPHTLCKYTSPTPAAACGKNVAANISSSDRARILKWHNDLRAKVAKGLETRGNPGPQPPASNMRTLKWDNELAKIAQRWADQCNFKHDACRDVDRFQVGQNLVQASSSSEVVRTIEELMNLWAAEVNKLDKNGVKKYAFDVNTGYYTQVVWAETRLIGCGITRYTASNGWKTVYIVCNYGPSGNVQGQPIYQIGTAASNCSTFGVSETISGLCN